MKYNKYKTLKDWLASGRLEGPGSDSQAYRSQKAMQLRAAMRPINYNDMTAEEQWETDKKLGILDVDTKRD